MRGLICGLIFMPIAAAAQSVEQIGTMANDVIFLTQGAQTVLKLSTSFSSVSISDPETMDALPKSDRVLTLVGRKVGVSDIVVFQDATVIYHAAVTVAPPKVPGKVFSHSKKNLNEFYAFQCNPVCTRIDDKFENRPPDVVILGPQGPVATGGAINVLVPPSRP
jgi:hypothetical protein